MSTHLSLISEEVSKMIVKGYTCYKLYGQKE